MDVDTGLDAARSASDPGPGPSVDPGRLTLDALRRFEPQGRRSRRQFLAMLAVGAGAVPALGTRRLMAQEPVGRTDRTILPTQHSAKVMRVVNTHEIEDVSQANLTTAAYNYITGGSEDEYTLRDNIEAYRRTRLRPRFLNDVSTIDTSLELLGQRLEYPILLCPTSVSRVYEQGDRTCATAAGAVRTLYCSFGGPRWSADLARAGQPPVWWGSTLGHADRSTAQEWARSQDGAGAAALSVTVDHRYVPNRDRNIRNGFPGYEAGVTRPVTPGLTWAYLDWIRGASNLPIVIKGILRGEDAELAVQHGAQAIIVSNHGGRETDGAVPTLMALPEVVSAVAGRVPVLIDGGIRRGSDILKALALGAKAVMIGRPYVWGVTAFGQAGVERVVELLRAELKVSMGLAGAASLPEIHRDLVLLPWER